MRNDSKSGLKIKEIISIVSIFVIISTSTQLLVSNKNINKETQNTEETVQEEEKIISETARTATSRSSVPRESSIKQEEIIQENYITISEIKISKNMDLTKRCGISKEDFKELMRTLKPDTSKFFYNNSDIIYDLCEKYELNEIFFCGLIAGESGWNISSNHRAKCNYISMMSKGKLIKYNTPKDGLEAAAKLLHTKYLTPGGSYYRGKTLSSVQKIFCPSSSTWVNLIYGCMNQIV